VLATLFRSVMIADHPTRHDGADPGAIEHVARLARAPDCGAKK
jgi:hypothetical protein